METHRLPLTASTSDYESQAAFLLDAWRSGEEEALRCFHQCLPRLRDEKVAWLPKRLGDDELRAQQFDMTDARETVARWYDFQSWEALTSFAAAIGRRDPEVYPFECAVDAVVEGDIATLRELLRLHPQLPMARSTRVTHFDPPVHRAMLLHYVAANGTENYRQKSPANAVEIATELLDAGADVNSLASLYGGECSTMSLLVSSCHPANAGVQIPLVELLISRGAVLTDSGKGQWVSPVETALVFGYGGTAAVLAKHGAPISLAAAAGLGDTARLHALLPSSDDAARHRALAIAAQSGQVETTRILLDYGEDPNRYNPPGTHAHTPPVHQAVWAGHLNVVRLLVDRGARLDLRDTIYDSTPLGWARYGGKDEIAAYLESTGAPV